MGDACAATSLATGDDDADDDDAGDDDAGNDDADDDDDDDADDDDADEDDRDNEEVEEDDGHGTDDDKFSWRALSASRYARLASCRKIEVWGNFRGVFFFFSFQGW